MSDRPERITTDNVLKVDVAAIAQDPRFDELKFENSKKKLPKIQKWILECEELGAQELLIDSDKNTLKSLKDQLTQHLENLLTFPIRTTNDTALNEHDSLEARAEDFYNSVYQQLPMRILPFLRQEAARITTDVKELEKQRKAAAQAQRDYEGLKEQITKELEDIRARRSEVEQEQGELVAIGLGKDFGDQADEYQTKANEWLGKRNTWLGILFGVIVVNILLFFMLFIGHLLKPSFISPDQVFTVQYGLAKLALLLVLSYAIGFCSRNYNINSGLAATNRHRKNVAEVLLNALSSQLTDEAKGEMVRLAANEMFKHLPVGFINKEHQNDSGPILEIVKKVSPSI